MYSSIALVRQYSGLRKLSDDVIRGEILRADAVVDSYLRQKYILPLQYRFAIALTFTRTGSTTGTLTLTIGGTAYNITVGASTTATQLADALREELEDVSTVYVDEIGSGVTVLLVSEKNSEDKTTAKAQVTTSETASVSGVTVTIGPIYKKYPAIVEYLSATMARGNLLSQNFGAEEEGTTRDGTIYMNEAYEQLKRIQGVNTNEESLRITDDYTGTEIPSKGFPVIRNYPNLTSDASGGTEPEFSVNSVF